MRSLLLLLCACPALAACGDDEKTPAGDTAAPDTSAPETVAEVTPETVAEVAAETVAEVAAETADTAAPAKVVAACSEADYSDCFINADCQPAERCENMSANDVEIPCCVTGPRGTKLAGEPCTSENECDTSLCLSYNDGPRLCSKPCADPAECPSAASDCVFGLCVAPAE